MELSRLGTEFFVPFFQQLWIFLDTPVLFGLSFRNFILGGFLIRISISLITLIFGIGSGGAYSYKAFDRRNKAVAEQYKKARGN